LTISGLSLWRLPPSLLGLDNHEAFPEFCAKAQNGFVAQENCFVLARATKQFNQTPIISATYMCVQSLVAPSMGRLRPPSLAKNQVCERQQVNRRRAGADPLKSCNFPERYALSFDLQQRMAVMGSGDIVVGRNFHAGKSSGTPENLEGAAPIQAMPGNAERHCGAMSEQRGDSGAVSTPQKFVHLVGCRDPKARPPSGR
jgi:hypothetical protein